MREHWEHFQHQADIGIRGFGNTRAAAFEQAALAMIAVMTDPREVQWREEVEVQCQADDDVMLLVDWINVIIFEISTRHMLFGKFEVSIGNSGQLTAKLWGEAICPARHHPAVEVKAATYFDACVAPCGHGWKAQCVVDV